MSDKQSRLLFPRHYVAAVSAAVVIALVVWLALGQNSITDPLAPIDLLSTKFITQPIETNAFLRLPMIEPRMRHLYTLPGTPHVWAVGESPLVLHSADGGKTWESHDVRRRSDNTFDVSAGYGHDGRWLASVFFADIQHGWVAGPAGLFATPDGGAHWIHVLPKEVLSDIVVAGGNGLAVGPRAVYLSGDGGRSWHPQMSLPFTGAVTASLLPVAGPVAWVTTREGEVWQTTNGAEWRRRFGPSAALANAQRLHFGDESRGEMLTPTGLHTTDDGGESWFLRGPMPPISPPAPRSLWRGIIQIRADPSRIALLTFAHERAGARGLSLEDGGPFNEHIANCRASGLLDDFVPVQNGRTVAIAEGEICRSITYGLEWQADRKSVV